jgi:hypothetical protein
MRKRVDFHKLEFIFSLGIRPDILNNFTLNWKIFNFCCCMIVKCQFRFNNKSNVTSLKENIGVRLLWCVVYVWGADLSLKDWTILMLYSELWVSVDILNVDLSSLSEVFLRDLAVTDIHVRTVLLPFEHWLCHLSLLLRSLTTNALLTRIHQCVTEQLQSK